MDLRKYMRMRKLWDWTTVKQAILAHGPDILLGFAPLVVEALLASLVVVFTKIAYEQSGGESRQQRGNQLSWPSALWALLAIALTDMADLPAKVGGYPEQLTFYLKSSPWTGLFNVVNTVVVVTASARSHGLKQGLRRAMVELSVRKFGVEGATHVTRRTVRMLLFVLGALPQAFKLFSCRGIPTVQFLASCYMLDFVNDEVIMWFSQSEYYRQQRNDNPASVVNEHLNSLNPYVPQYDWFFIDCSLLFNLIWALNLAALGILFQGTMERVILNVISLAMAGILYIPIFLDGKSRIALSRYVKSELQLLVFATKVVAVWSIALAWFRRQNGTFVSWTEIFSSSHAFQLFGIVEAVETTAKMLRRTFQVYNREHADDFPTFAHMMLLPIALGSYFAFHYDAAATYKPNWVEWLG